VQGFDKLSPNGKGTSSFPKTTLPPPDPLGAAHPSSTGRKAG